MVSRAHVHERKRFDDRECLWEFGFGYDMFEVVKRVWGLLNINVFWNFDMDGVLKSLIFSCICSMLVYEIYLS